MRVRSFAVLVIFLLATAVSCTREAPRVLVFSKTEGFRHASITEGLAAIRQLGAEVGFAVEATEDAAIFNEADLPRFGAVVFLSTTGDVLDEAQQDAFSRYIQSGGGYVGIHAASDTEYGWPWYGRLVGGYFASHPNNPNVREATLLVADADDPSTAHLGDTWTRADEWYDFGEMEPGLEVLLMIDETSYKSAEENPAPAPRPIAWRHDFEGGRVFYTGLGHTAESFAEPAFLAHLSGGIAYALGDGTPRDYTAAHVRPEENRFNRAILDQNLDEPTELAVLDADRILFLERGGAVKLHDRRAGTTKSIAQIEVFHGNEEGLIGVTTDPGFATNGWLYLAYSHPTEPQLHLSRFTLTDDTLDPSSEKILLTIPVDRGEACCHVGGSLTFDAEGRLYLSVGENTNPHGSDGYAPIDTRPGREAWNALRSAGNPHDLRGAILRIQPQPDGTYTIPEGNLFADSTDGRPEIYVMGNRNPYRIAVDEKTGSLYWGEVGPDASGDDPERGPRGYDEINQAREAGFFGWPYFIADNKPYRAYDFATGQSGAPFDPARPMWGGRALPPAQPAFIWYPYGESELFPEVGESGRTAMAGPVFHRDDFPDTDVRFPAYYDGKLFIYEWMRGWIMAVTMDDDGRFVSMEQFLPRSLTLSNPIDMAFGSDGALYVLEYGKAWFEQNLDARLTRITYNDGNRPPQPALAATPNVGAPPLTVAFSAEGSVDHDGDALRYAWDFDGDGTSDSDAAAPTHTYTTPGSYLATLTVRDGDGATATEAMPIRVGHEPPSLTLTLGGNQTFFFDAAPPTYTVTVTDAEDGSLADGTISAEQVVVTLGYVPEGEDLALPAQGHQAAAAQAALGRGARLIAASDCSACHQERAASVGPSWLDVAERYAGDEDATDELAAKIINGGGGNWGDRAMAAHPTLSLEDAQAMVRHIRSLLDEDAGLSLPPTGTLPLAEHAPGDTEGRYLVTASYTDRGDAAIGPLTARQAHQLRAPFLEAEAYDDGEAVWTMESDGATLLGGDNAAFFVFEGIDLTGVGAISARVQAWPGASGTIHLHLDAPDGTRLGTLTVSEANPTPRVRLDGITGRHDLYLVFDAETGGGGVVDYLQFHHTAEVLTP